MKLDTEFGVLVFALVFAAVAAACQPEPLPVPPSPRGERPESEWPRSVDAAVDLLVMELQPDDIAALRAMPKTQLITLHHGFGTGIRNSFGLWRGNSALLKSCDDNDPRRPPGTPPPAYPISPDGCSGVIIEKLWDRLQQEPAN